MRFGLGIFATDETTPPGDLGRLAEQRGFDALLLTEHTHMPVDHLPYPGGGELPRPYKRCLDPFVALAAVAEATTSLKLGFGISLVIQRDPITTAKEVATLDWLSGGRVLFGVGAGWNRPEIENHGYPFEGRFGRMREHVEAMRAIWTQEEASYAGRHVNFGPLWSWPKPVQDPLPVYVGGNGERVLDRVLRWGDHWMPNRETPNLAERIAQLHSRAEAAGRPRPQVCFFGINRGDREMAERLRNAGVDLAVLMLPTAAPGEVERAADEAVATAAALRG